VGAPGSSFGVWTGWNSEVAGSINTVPQMPDPLDLTSGIVELPAVAKALPIFGPNARLKITVTRRADSASGRTDSPR
jgi:hypothetical protein